MASARASSCGLQRPVCSVKGDLCYFDFVSGRAVRVCEVDAGEPSSKLMMPNRRPSLAPDSPQAVSRERLLRRRLFGTGRESRARDAAIADHRTLHLGDDRIQNRPRTRATELHDDFAAEVSAQLRQVQPRSGGAT